MDKTHPSIFKRLPHSGREKRSAQATVAVLANNAQAGSVSTGIPCTHPGIKIMRMIIITTQQDWQEHHNDLRFSDTAGGLQRP